MIAKFLILLVSSLVLVGCNRTQVNQVESKPSVQTEKVDQVSVNDKESGEVSMSEKFIEFDNNLEEFANKRRVIFFYASWCPTCKAAEASLLSNLEQIPQDVVVIRLNYNDNNTDEIEKSLAKKYGITYQHTFVQIDSNGDEVTKWNGGKIEELVKNVK